MIIVNSLGFISFVDMKCFNSLKNLAEHMFDQKIITM
jgi:hypothetical protein